MSSRSEADRPLAYRVLHADWNKHPSRRWLARAGRTASGRWVLARPEPVGDPGALILRHGEGVGTGRSVLLGFDFPIGLPEAYTGLAGIDSFREVLGLIGMLDALLDPEGVPEPSAEAVVRIEGWIFGRPVP